MLASSGSDRKAKQPVRQRDEGGGRWADLPNDFGMRCVEPAGERAEGGQDQLGGRCDEAAARDAAAAQVARRSLGWKWPDISGRGSSRTRFVAKDDPADFHLLDEPAAAMVGEAGVVVADDPGPVEPRRSARSASRAPRRAGGRSRSGRGSCRRGNRAASRRSARPRRASAVSVACES